MRIFKILIDFPALAAATPVAIRWLDYLEGRQQKEIDALTQQLTGSTTSYQQTRTGLDEAIQTQKE